jgi:hypothetical protein
MSRRLKVTGLILAAIGLMVECAFIPSEASAITSPNGPYFEQGTVVNLCFDTTNERSMYVELHSNVIGNCAAGYVQLSVWADPDAVIPEPAATP